MPIIRTKLEHEDHFTQIPNSWLRDGRLSLKSIGLLAQLLSHSQGWSVSIETLAKANNCGKDLIRGAIVELEQAGYLVRKQERKGSLFAEAIYYTAAPLSGFPMSENPMSENPTPKNKSIKNKSIKKEYAQSEEWFDLFWESYPRKVGRAAAKRAWLKAIEDYPKEEIQAGTARLAADPNLPPMQYVPYPATWLNRQGWLDDPYPPRERSKEDLEEQRRAEALKRRESDRERSQALLRELEEQAKAATPPPLCEHGEKIVFCKLCMAKGAKSD